MGTQSFWWIRRCTIAILIAAVLLAGMGKISSVAAAPATEQQAKEQKAESILQIAQEYMKRGLYPQAQAQLVAMEQEYGRFLSDVQKQKAKELTEQIQTALEERKKIAAAIEQSDKLIEEGNSVGAKSMLQQIQSSPYLSEAERKMVAASLKKAEEKLAEQQRVLEQQAEPQIPQTEPNQPKTQSAEPNQPKIEAMEPKTQPAESKPQPAEPKPQPQIVPAGPAPAVTQLAAEPNAVSAQQESSYLQEVRRKQAVQISYTKAVINDALSKADEAMVKKDFEMARSSLRRAFSTIEHNQILLGDEYASMKAQLTRKEEQAGTEEKNYVAQQAQAKQQQADQITRQNREKMESQRTQAIRDYMERAYAFQSDERYEDAMGQLELLLAIDPHNQKALIMKKTLENTLRWRTQLEDQRESDKEEMALILEANRQAIPYSKTYTEGINYPRNWKDIAARREKMEEERSPVDAAINKLLNQTVDLSALTETTTLTEAIEILRRSVEPPLPIVVMWKDLTDNAFIQPDTVINMSGQALISVPLRVGLDRVLQSVSAAGGLGAELGYVIDYGVVTVATRANLPTEFKNEIYDVAEQLNPPANYGDSMMGGMGGGMGGMGGGMGGMGGGMGGGMMGGGMGGGMMGGGGMGGGMMGGGGMGGGMMGGGGMGGGMMGGGMGGMGGGMMGGGMGGGMMGGMGGGMMGGGGNWLSQMRGYQLINVIVQTIAPESWDISLSDVGIENGGRITLFGDKQLIIWQTPQIHEEIRKFIKELGKNMGQQIAIEARFLLVDENYLKDVGLDVDINRFRVGGIHSVIRDTTVGQKGVIEDITQNSAGNYSGTTFTPGLAAPSATNIPGSLGGYTTPAMLAGFGYGGPLDDLQVDFMIRATEIHQNAKQLSAPKAMVLNGESATLSVMTSRSVHTDSELNSETVTTNGVAQTLQYITNTYDDFSDGVSLSIAPTISSDKKYVLLNITTYLLSLDATPSEVATLGFSSQGVPLTASIFHPVTQTSSIQTRVSVPDRGTVLLGGLTLTANRDKEAGVPILSKIPVLGRFFSNSSTVQDKRILLILVKPTIVLREEGEEDAAAAMSGS